MSQITLLCLLPTLSISSHEKLNSSFYSALFFIKRIFFPHFLIFKLLFTFFYFTHITINLRDVKGSETKVFYSDRYFSKFDKPFVNASQRFLEKTPKRTKNLM